MVAAWGTDGWPAGPASSFTEESYARKTKEVFLSFCGFGSFVFCFVGLWVFFLGANYLAEEGARTADAEDLTLLASGRKGDLVTPYLYSALDGVGAVVRL